MQVDSLCDGKTWLQQKSNVIADPGLRNCLNDDKSVALIGHQIFACCAQARWQ